MFVYNTQKLHQYVLHTLIHKGEWSTEITLDKFIEGHLTFTDRESYLSWVKSWKEQYNALTAKCRSYKKLTDWNEWIATNPQGNRSDLYYQARMMLMIRALGKVRSWEMKQKNMASR